MAKGERDLRLRFAPLGFEDPSFRMSTPESQPLNALYGINAVKQAIGARPVEYVLVAQGQRSGRVQEIIDACRAAGVPLRFAPRPALERAAGTAQHQNVVAICSAKAYDDLEAVVAGATASGPPLLVVLDGVEDPANLGAVVRTAVAAGAHGVGVPGRGAAGLSPAGGRGPGGGGAGKR